MQKEHNKGGRPAFVITDKMRNNVKLLAGCGLAADKIAMVIGCHERTLQRRFKAELKAGGASVEAAAVNTVLVNLHKGGSVGQRAAEFLLHCRFGWSRYAPPPAAPKEPELGKKEALNRAAETKHEETSWGDVVH